VGGGGGSGQDSEQGSLRAVAIAVMNIWVPSKKQ